MKSIKPSKETLIYQGIIGIFIIIVGVGAIIMGAIEFIPFIGPGVVAVVFGAFCSIRCFKNAFGESRESMYDIVDAKPKNGVFCPYCGAKTEKEYAYCAECGKKLP